MLCELRLSPGRVLGVLFFLYGFVTLSAQLLLLRELGILFYGNELFIGFSLGSWLLWTGLGSFTGRCLPASVFGWVWSCLAIVIPLEVVSVRLSKMFFGFGMMASPLEMLLLTASLLFPIGVVSGLVFATGCSFVRERKLLTPARIYFLESAGAIASGLFYTFLFAGRFSNFTLSVFLSTVIIIANFLSFGMFTGKKFRVIFVILALGMAALCLWPLDTETRRLEWRGYEFLESHDSRYANLAIARTQSLINFFQDGMIVSSFPDPAGHEEIAHWPLLASENPADILLIGSWATGELGEVLKHPVACVDYVEIDEAVLPLLVRYLRTQDIQALRDKRVKIHHLDGRVFLKRTEKFYDVIILNLPEPSNAQVNRFYTEEFFHEVRERLKPGGILSFALPTSENYLPSQVLFLNQSVYRTLRLVFNNVGVVPGSPLILLAGKDPFFLDPAIFASRYGQRHLKNIQVVPSYFPVKLERGRTAFIEDELGKRSRVALNRDFAPISYFHAFQVWLLKFQDPMHFLWLFVFIGFAAWGLHRLWKKREEFFGERFEWIVMFLSGFAAMLYEILLLFAFQGAAGYVYWQIGLLFAAFMAGMAIGSGIALGQKSPPQKSFYLFFLCLQAFYGIFLGIFLLSFEKWRLGISPVLLFILLMVPVGLLPGYLFARAVRVKDAAAFYAADLWGSALGAFLTGLLLVPVFGLVKLFWIIPGVLIIFTLVLARSKKAAF